MQNETVSRRYAVAIFSRPDTAIIAATSGLWESVTKRSLKPALKVGAISLAGLLLLLLYNRINADRWTLFPGSYTGRVEGAVSTGAHGRAHLGTWVASLTATVGSPLRGLLVYSPFLVLLLPGLVRAWRAAPSWVRSSAVGGVLYLVAQLAENTWEGGDAFYGYRIALMSVFACAPLLTLCWTEWTAHAAWRRRTLTVLVAVTMWTFAVASVVSNADLGPSSSAVPQWPWTRWVLIDVLRATNPATWLLAAVFVVAVGWVVRRYEPPRVPEPAQPVRAATTGAAPSRRTNRSEPGGGSRPGRTPVKVQAGRSSGSTKRRHK